MILAHLKHMHESIQAIISHPKVIAVLHWLKRPFIQHLILVMLSTLVASSLLPLWHAAPALQIVHKGFTCI